MKLADETRAAIKHWIEHSSISVHRDVSRNTPAVGDILQFGASGQYTPTPMAGLGIDHGTLGGLTDDDHPQYILGDRSILRLYDGAAIETIDIGWSESGGTVSLTLEADGGGDIQFFFAATAYTLDCTPTATVALTAGTDTNPQINYIYVTESGGTLTLTNSTAGFPATAHAPVATVLVQSAASVATDGPYKVHAWTDHINSASGNGHLAHLNKKFRALNATWVSGCAPADLATNQISTTAGVVFQLHTHDMPARDMSTGDPIYVVNEPTTPYKRITSFGGGGISQMSDGTAFTNGRYMNFVLVGVVSEDATDCKLLWLLPDNDYTFSASAQADNANTASYSVGSDFTGTSFLIARYTLQYSLGGGGTFTQVLKTDLRGLEASTSPGGGAITDHGNLSGLTDDDHTQYLLHDGTRPMTGQLDLDGNAIANVPIISGDGTAMTVQNNVSLTVRAVTSDVRLQADAGTILLVGSDLNCDSNNITNPGTVDGRDVAADGTRIDILATANSLRATDHLNADVEITAAQDTICMRSNGANSDVGFQTMATARARLNVEDGADVTDATNVAAAGALMDSDLSFSNQILTTNTIGTIVARTIANDEFVMKDGTGNVDGYGPTRARAVLNVADGADVTPADVIQDADFTGTYTADLRRTGAGAYVGARNNTTAAALPTVNDDSASGYAIGSWWCFTVVDYYYICVDATVGAAVWNGPIVGVTAFTVNAAGAVMNSDFAAANQLLATSTGGGGTPTPVTLASGEVLHKPFGAGMVGVSGVHRTLVYENEGTNYSSDVTERTLIDHTIPADVLETQRRVEAELEVDMTQGSGGTVTHTIRMYWNGVVVAQDNFTTATNGTIHYALKIKAWVQNNGATNAQRCGLEFTQSGAGGGGMTVGRAGECNNDNAKEGPAIGANATVDTTSAVQLKVTLQTYTSSAVNAYQLVSGITVLK